MLAILISVLILNCTQDLPNDGSEATKGVAHVDVSDLVLDDIQLRRWGTTYVALERVRDEAMNRIRNMAEAEPDGSGLTVAQCAKWLGVFRGATAELLNKAIEIERRGLLDYLTAMDRGDDAASLRLQFGRLCDFYPTRASVTDRIAKLDDEDPFVVMFGDEAARMLIKLNASMPIASPEVFDVDRNVIEAENQRVWREAHNEFTGELLPGRRTTLPTEVIEFVIRSARAEAVLDEYALLLMNDRKIMVIPESSAAVLRSVMQARVDQLRTQLGIGQLVEPGSVRDNTRVTPMDTIAPK